MISIQDFNDSEYFITIDGEFVLVKGFVEKEAEKGTLKKDNAYIKGDHCYIYGGKLKEPTGRNCIKKYVFSEKTVDVLKIYVIMCNVYGF